MPNTFRIAQAARLLGVSDDTVRRWIDQGVLPTTGASPTEIPGAALAERAVALAAEPDDPTAIASSARNRFVGIVTRVQIDGLMAQVDLQCGPHRVVCPPARNSGADHRRSHGLLSISPSSPVSSSSPTSTWRCCPFPTRQASVPPPVCRSGTTTRLAG